MIRSLFTALAITVCAAMPALAQSQYTIQNVARLDILPGYKTSSGHMIAAQIKLKPGWKTYWRAPGGNGIPPTFDWSGSTNIASVVFHWPEPSVFIKDGLRTIGYKTELVLPIAITARNPSRPIALKGQVDFGVCDDVCLPVRARFQLETSGSDAASQKAIQAALKSKPQTGKSAGIHGLKCTFTPIKDGFRIAATMRTRSTIKPDTFSVFEFPHPDVWIEQNEPTISGNIIHASASLYAYGDTPLILDRSKINLTLLGGPRAIELRGCPS